MSNENLFLNTVQFPRKIADKIEHAATNGPWWYLPDCAHPIGHELQTDRNPYFSCTIIKDRIPKLEYSQHYDLSFFSKYIRMEKHVICRAHVTMHYPNPKKFGVPHNFHIDQQFPHIVHENEIPSLYQGSLVASVDILRVLESLTRAIFCCVTFSEKVCFIIRIDK